MVAGLGERGVILPHRVRGASWIRSTTFFERVGILGVLLVAFFAWVGVAGAYTGLALVVVASVASCRYSAFSQLVHTPSMAISLGLLAYVAGWAIVMKSDVGELGDSVAWMLLFAPLLTYWFFRFPQLVPWVFCLAGAGVFYESISVVVERWHEFVTVLDNGRVFAGRAWGLYLSCVALGMLIFAPRVCRWSGGVLWGRWLFAFYVLIFLWILQCVVASKERVAWASFVIVLLGVLLVAGWGVYRERNKNKKALLLSLFGLGLPMIAVLVLNMGAIEKRFENDREDIQKILTGGGGDLTSSSATQRYLVFKYGIEQWMTAPFFGLGPRNSEEIIETSKEPMLSGMAHFHSTYLEVLVHFGALGLILYLTLVFSLLRDIFICYRCGLLDRDYWIFGVSVFVLALLYSVMGSRVTHPDWLFFWLLLCGFVQSCGFRYRTKLTRA